MSEQRINHLREEIIRFTKQLFQDCVCSNDEALEALSGAYAHWESILQPVEQPAPEWSYENPWESKEGGKSEQQQQPEEDDDIPF